MIGGPRFYERAEVKDATAYLQVLDNPPTRSACFGSRTGRSRGIGDTTISRLVSYAESHGSTLYEALGHPFEAGLGAAAVKAVTGLKNLLDSLRSAAQELDVQEAPAGGARAQRRWTRTGRSGRSRRAGGSKIEAFVDGARQYVQETEEPTLSGFLQEISLYSDQDALGDEQ